MDKNHAVILSGAKDLAHGAGNTQFRERLAIFCEVPRFTRDDQLKRIMKEIRVFLPVQASGL